MPMANALLKTDLNSVVIRGMDIKWNSLVLILPDWKKIKML